MTTMSIMNLLKHFMSKSSFVTSCILILLSASMAPIIGYAETNLGVQSIEKVQVFNKSMDSDTVIQGVVGNGMLSFNVSSYWEIVENPVLHLNYSSSGSKGKMASTLSVFINERPLKMLNLPEASVSEINVDLVIPKHYIQVGYNEIRFKTWHTLTGQLFEDDGNPGNWLSINKTTEIQFPYQEHMENLTLKDFPFPYIKVQADQPVAFRFLASDDGVSEAVSQSIATFSAEVGHLVPFQNTHMEVTDSSVVPLNSHYVFIGSVIPEKLKPLLKRNLGIYNDKVTYYSDFMNANYSVLMILSKNEALLNEGVQTLFNSKISKQLNGNYAELDQRDLNPKVNVLSEDRISFKDLGYNNVLMRGIKETSTAYFVDFPDQWLISKGARLILNIRYSDQIDSLNSSLTVVVNAIPLGSVQLDQASSREKIVSFVIPDELLTASSYNIVVKYYLSGSVNYNDAFNRTDFWNFTSNESLLELPHTIKSGFTLSDFPAPFIGNGGMEDLNIVIGSPQHLEAQTLMANVASFIGHQLMTASKVTVSYSAINAKKHNIVIGDWESPIVKANNNKLNIPLNADGKSFKLSVSKDAITSIQPIVGSLQLKHDASSPFSELWIVAPDEKGYSITEKVATDLQLSNALAGDVALIDSTGYVQTTQINAMSKDEIAVSTTLLKAEEKDNATAKRVSYENARNFVIFGGVLILLMAIAIFVFNSKRNTL